VSRRRILVSSAIDDETRGTNDVTTLLTGGNGWVPSFVLRQLAQRGERVISYDLMPVDDVLREHLDDAIANVTFVHGDVTDGEHLLDIAQEAGVTRIIHTAAITPRLWREQKEPRRVIDVNLGGTINALEAARALPGFERFVYVGSGAVWGSGHTGETIDEDAPSRTTNLYGITKYASERIAMRYKELFGLDIVSMRPANVYGPMERDTPGYVGATELREMLRVLAAGEELRVASLDGPYHDWTFVEDIAEGIVRAWATPNLPHDVYSITCGRQYSIGEMLAAFKRAWPEIEYRLVPEDEANTPLRDAPRGPRPKNDRILADFGWAPSTPLDEGVAIYLNWVRANGPQ
jgi:nucleoside-diphosphate-sugar epimerase